MVGIVGAAAVLGFCLNVVIALSAIAIVIDLEVATGLIKTILVPYVVHDIVPEEQVGDGGILIASRLLVQVEREVKDEVGTAVGAETGSVVVVTVFICVNIVATGNGEFSTGLAIGVVPAKRRGVGIGRIDLQGAGTVVGAF